MRVYQPTTQKRISKTDRRPRVCLVQASRKMFAGKPVLGPRFTVLVTDSTATRYLKV